MSADNRKIVMDSEGFRQSIARMGDEIMDAAGDRQTALVGIRTGGVFLAQRLLDHLNHKGFESALFGIIDITLYRDDWTRIAQRPIVGKTELDFSIDDKRVILVDDVLFTGRTIRAALDALIDFGRPARIEVAALVDRGHRELPICPTYTGLTVDTRLDERVNVYFSEQGVGDQVVVESASAPDS
jgi:pyrimidine operon attenuation protein/uracil phosphoribosyltransferase